MGSTGDSKRNLIIVSNRLPLSIKRVDGKFQSSLSSGGLVTSLSGLCKSTQFQWFGWPGLEVKDQTDRGDVEKSLAEHHAVPIFLDSDLAHEHYNGFSSMQAGPSPSPKCRQGLIPLTISRSDLVADPTLSVWSSV